MPNPPPMRVNASPQDYIKQVFATLAADPRAQQATALQGAAWSPQLQQTEMPSGPTGVAMPDLQEILREAEQQQRPGDVVGDLLRKMGR